MLKTVTNSINASQIQTPITLPGDVTLSTGNLVIGTSGKGIDFSATPGTGTSELLADYEEGTWTPNFSTWSVAPTSVGASAFYTKVGRQVTVNLLAQNGVSLGASQISGLPFTSRALHGATGVLVAINAASTNCVCNIPDNSTTISYIGAVNFGASYWCLSITYIV